MSVGRDKRYLAEFVLELEQARNAALERAAAAEQALELVKGRAMQLAEEVIALKAALAAKE